MAAQAEAKASSPTGPPPHSQDKSHLSDPVTQGWLRPNRPPGGVG